MVAKNPGFLITDSNEGSDWMTMAELSFLGSNVIFFCFKLGHVAKKPVFWDTDQVPQKPGLQPKKVTRDLKFGI